MEDQLRETRTTDQEKREMMEILQRFNKSGEMLRGDDMSEEEEESGAEEDAEEGLSAQTLAKLMAQVILLVCLCAHALQLRHHWQSVLIQALCSARR